LFNPQIISGDHSKMPFMVRSAALFTEIMPRASIRQGLLFPTVYKGKLTRSVNAKNVVRRASRANDSEGEDHNFFQILSIQTLIRNKNSLFKTEILSFGGEVSLPVNFFSEFIYALYF